MQQLSAALQESLRDSTALRKQLQQSQVGASVADSEAHMNSLTKTPQMDIILRFETFMHHALSLGQCLTNTLPCFQGLDDPRKIPEPAVTQLTSLLFDLGCLLRLLPLSDGPVAIMVVLLSHFEFKIVEAFHERGRQLIMEGDSRQAVSSLQSL